MKRLFTLFLLLIGSAALSQVGIGTLTPEPSSVLDISASDKGILIPQVSLNDVSDTMLDGVNTAATGLLIYNTNAAIVGGSGAGYYSFNGSSWEKLLSTAEPVDEWTLSGNTGTGSGNFIGTIDNQPLYFRANNLPAGQVDSTSTNTSFGYKTLNDITSGTVNTVFGYQAHEFGTTTAGNTAFGHSAMRNQIGPNGHNTAIGREAMENANNSSLNVAIGWRALRTDTIGDQNVAVGVGAMEYGAGMRAGSALGRYALANDNYSVGSTAVGYRALISQTFDNSGTTWTSYNTGIGAYALAYNNPTATSNGIYNTAVGGVSLYRNTTGTLNTAVGVATLYENTTGSNNTAMGYSALRLNETGTYNTSIGTYSLDANTLGFRNVAVGSVALSANTTGSYNTAVGVDALQQNTDADFNTGIGFEALKENTTGNENTALGFRALRGVSGSTTHTGNTAVGFNSMLNVTTGNQNTAMGHYSLANITSGGLNVALGGGSLESNTVGERNIGIGFWAMRFNTESSLNVAIGNQALYNQSFANGGTVYYGYNVAVGYNSLLNNQPTTTTNGRLNTALGATSGTGNTIGSFNTYVGALASASAGNYDNSTALGYNTFVTASNQIRLGNGGITSIGGWQPWTNLSDERLKQDVREDVSGLNFIRKLRPVSYNLNEKIFEGEAYKDLDVSEAKQLRHTGFIAQDVEAAASSLDFDFSGVDRPKNGDDHYGLRYATFVVPLVKAVQEQQDLIEAQQAEIEALKNQMSAILSALNTKE